VVLGWNGKRKNLLTHPLPRGGTDLTPLRCDYGDCGTEPYATLRCVLR
jgi:hypothetical protein